MGTGEGGDKKVGHADCAVAYGAGRQSLRAERYLPMFVIGWQVFICQAAV